MRKMLGFVLVLLVASSCVAAKKAPEKKDEEKSAVDCVASLQSASKVAGGAATVAGGFDVEVPELQTGGGVARGGAGGPLAGAPASAGAPERPSPPRLP